MKFSAATLLACAVIANAAVVPETANSAVAPHEEAGFSGVFVNGELTEKLDEDTKDKRDVEDEEGAVIEARLEKAAIKVIAVAAIPGLAGIVGGAVLGGIYAAAKLKDWTRVREVFTQETTLEMWKKNPDYQQWPAVVCYNKGYHLETQKDIAKGEKGTGLSGWTKAKLSMGLFHTDYDCMYMSGNNAFYTNEEGGYINLSYRWATGRCNYDPKTGDLRCH
ncbi:hypothetical protein NHQ30_009645 [Ciborinia camelliae]|nr:hypothetical protein NHQ30_009645 [Ciborinia camelliae]